MDNQPSESRRDFLTYSIAAGLAAAMSPTFAQQAGLAEENVEFRTPDGNCDAAFIHPANGAHPAVIIWPDAFGLRPSMRAFARRLAADGYSVLVPNPFYRVSKAPQFEDASKIDFGNAADRARIQPLMASIGAAGAAEKDAQAFVAFLDAQKSVDTRRGIGTQGYCMGGALVFRTAAAVPGRIAAGASFHGGGLVTDQPSSPHLLVPKMKARLYVGVASNDDQKQPDVKEQLRVAFASAKIPAEIEVSGGLHGWCVPDMPLQSGKPIYDKADAEKAWSKLLVLYKTALRS
jgi:carboxymethylenebutenolidase